MLIPCSSHAHLLLILCSSHSYLTLISCSFHAHLMLISCSFHVHLLLIACLSHAPLLFIYCWCCHSCCDPAPPAAASMLRFLPFHCHCLCISCCLSVWMLIPTSWSWKPLMKMTIRIEIFYGQQSLNWMHWFWDSEILIQITERTRLYVLLMDLFM